MKKFNLSAAFILSVVLFAAGCGKKDQQTTGDNKVTTTEQQQQQQQNQQNQTTGENKSGANELGIKEGMPADFPKDVPQPVNSKCLGSLNTSEGTVVTFESTDRPKDVLGPFAAEVEKGGFKKADGEMMNDEGGMSVWNKEKREVSIMLAWDKDKKTSSVVITYR